jgi:hypothetical protein
VASAKTLVWASMSDSVVGGAHQRHVVERRQEHATIQSIEVEEAFEFEIGGGVSFSTVAGRVLAKRVFGTGTQAGKVPGQAGSANLGGYAIREAASKFDHVLECGRGEDMLKRSAHGSERERVSGQSAADAADVAVF